MSMTAASKFKSIRDFPELVEYLGDELDWPIETDDFEEMTFEYSAAELGLDEKTAPKFLEIRRLRPLNKDQPWGIFFIRFDDNKLPVVALRRLLSKLVLKKRSTSNTGDRASWHESDLLLISQTGNLGTQSISFAHFAANPEKTDLPILKVLGWDDDDTGLKIDYVIETLREKLIWPEDPTDSDAWRAQWRDAFTLKNREVIQSSKEMAERLGQLALAVRTRLREVLAIESDEGPIHKLMSVFKENLISDLDTDSFSDMYAQTIAYGLLSARIINPKADTADAAHTQIPITNPFLRDLMETFLNVGGRSHSGGVGLDFDELGINEVVDLLDNTNMEAVLRDFGDRNQKEDPVMHFFEGFLQEYDSKIRKDRGVFYTPQPVVSFIVRSVDEQLRTEFGLADGLADTTTWGELAARTTGIEIPEGTSPDQAFVQILDPATGTGTFPVEVINLIYKTMTAKWQSQGNREAQIKELWNEYVPKHLLPRLHGYELMMAPYAIAHMKIGLKLYETGYRFKSDQRARIYLTNALEPAQDFSGTFAFAIPSLAREAQAVSAIKRDQRFTVVIGNPPYSGHSSNDGAWINDLVDDYFSINREPIHEANSKWLRDDYVKFIRLGQYVLQYTGAGVLSYITNHGYIDNPTFRAMRYSLIDAFNTITVLDLHGNTKKRELDEDGNPDSNVFDIQQGVAIFSCGAISTLREPSIRHAHLWGSRDAKYQVLQQKELSSLASDTVVTSPPHYVLAPQNTALRHEFNSFIKVAESLVERSLGILTKRDALAVGFNSTELEEKLKRFANPSISNDVVSAEFGVPVADKDKWSLPVARKALRSLNSSRFCSLLYRPFDYRVVYYDDTLVARPNRRVLSNFIGVENNRALLLGRQGMATGSKTWDVCFVSAGLSDQNIYRRGGGTVFPLFLAEGSGDLLSDGVNLNFRETFNTQFHEFNPTPSDLFDYMYGILSSPNYRKRYAEFLKMDFPSIPVPSSETLFRSISKLGKRLSDLHVMSCPSLSALVTSCVGEGEFQVEKVSYSNETVWIDKAKTRGFEGVLEEVWKFHIGGYQVCEKWLKDREAKGGKNPRQGRVLTDEDVEHYQKILVAISETIRIMAKIDETIEAHGGWPDAFITANS